ncbi:MAG: trigger factor [Thiohalocapsa sp.]|jgi:trigger factor
MHVTVATGEGLAREMRVELSAEEIEQEVDKRLRDVARNARLPGFRPGKVPMRVLRQRFGDSVRGEVFGEKVEASFSEAIANEELRPAGVPQIEPDVDKAAQRYAYTARFEVLPEIELRDLSGRQIKRPVAEVTEGDVDTMIERLREQRKTWSEVERPAVDGDRVTISFRGTVDGQMFEGGSGEDQPVVIGSGRLVPGFEEQLIGAAAGDARTVEIAFPADYRAEDLAGKDAVFDVQIAKVEEPVLPALDEEFFREFGIGEGGLEAFRADVRANMERELGERLKARVKEQVMDALIDANPVDAPSALIEREIKELKGQAQPAARGGSFDLPDSLFADTAKRRVMLGLLIAEVAKRYQLQPDPERIRSHVDELAATYDEPQSVVDYYYADRARLSSIESLVLEQMVVDRLLEDVEIVDEPTTFAAVTSPQSST